jgi:protease I
MEKQIITKINILMFGIAAGILTVFVVLPADLKAEQGPSSETKLIKLAEPKLKGKLTLEEALEKRRSIRSFTGKSLTMEQISQLAWSGQGITEKEKGFRTAPSAGAIFPIELYVAIPEGLFVYRPVNHSLEKVVDSDVRAKLAEASFGQRWVADAGADFIIAGSEKKLAAKYGSKANVYMLLEAGHIGQNILLQAVSLDLGAVPIGAFNAEEVNKICKLPKDLESLYIISVGQPVRREEEKKQERTEKMEAEKEKKAVLIVASKNFRDEELFDTKRALESAGIHTIIASSKTGAVTGMLGGSAEAIISVEDVIVDNYDAIIFIGGSGAKEYFNNKTALQIARQAAEKEKILAAICIAPSVLANAGVLEGKKATSFASEAGNLRKAKAVYTGSGVERDGLIITGNGPAAATRFGQTIVKALEEK